MRFSEIEKKIRIGVGVSLVLLTLTPITPLTTVTNSGNNILVIEFDDVKTTLLCTVGFLFAFILIDKNESLFEHRTTYMSGALFSVIGIFYTLSTTLFYIGISMIILSLYLLIIAFKDEKDWGHGPGRSPKGEYLNPPDFEYNPHCKRCLQNPNRRREKR